MVKKLAREKKAPSKVPAEGVSKGGWRTAGMVFLMCAWVVFAVIAVQFAVGFLMVRLLGTDVNKPVWTATFSAITYILAMALVILVPPLLMREVKKTGRVQKKLARTEKRMELGLMGLPTWADIGLAPIGFIVSMVLAAILVTVFSLFPWFDAEQVQEVGFSVYMSGGDRIIAFLTLVVMAPIAEEIIFRGWLYGKMRNRLLGKMPEIWGIALSTFVVSLVFGLVHMQWNVGVNVFALSVVLCILREITGTIYSGILTHMIKNGVAFFLLYVIGVG